MSVFYPSWTVPGQGNVSAKLGSTQRRVDLSWLKPAPGALQRKAAAVLSLPVWGSNEPDCTRGQKSYKVSRQRTWFLPFPIPNNMRSLLGNKCHSRSLMALHGTQINTSAEYGAHIPLRTVVRRSVDIVFMPPGPNTATQGASQRGD